MYCFQEPYKIFIEKEVNNSQENLGILNKGNWPSHILRYAVKL